MGFNTYLLDLALKKKRERLEKERKELLDKVINLLFLLKKKYSIKEAYILGSLLNPKKWSILSDIDIAVSGCSKHILDIMSELEKQTNKEVDVIDIDRHFNPDLIRKKGKKIYG